MKVHLRSTHDDAKKEQSGLESWISEPDNRHDERSEMTKTYHLATIRAQQTRTARKKIPTRMDRFLRYMTGSL